MSALVAPLQILLTLFVSLKLMVSSAQEVNQFIYNGFQGANLNLSGIAKIHPNGLLELTNTSNQEIGHAFFPFPFKFNASSPTNSLSSLSFSTTFVFAMVPKLPTHGGHGIAFAISPSIEFVGAHPTQFLGLLNSTSDGLPSNHLVAIELDSAKSPDLKDINPNHVGIDINSLKSIESAPVTYFLGKKGTNESLELLNGDPIQVWIDYHDEEKLLNVTLAPLRIPKPEMPLLSKRLELSQILIESMYVGFSAATGSVSSSHYILGWSFNKSGEAQSLDPSKLPSLPSVSKSRVKVSVIMVLIGTLTAIVLLITVCGTILVTRKRYEEVREDWEKEYGPQRFSYEILYKATGGFRDKGLLGAGGFGKVFRGTLPSSKTEIAVKKISHNSTQGMKEFVAEIASMGRLRHRNLVQLLGYCRRKGELFLVYDYMPNGSLDKFIFTEEGPNLNWDQRFRIIKGVASGLFYLHHEWEQVVLHRDVKASNVLLDENFNARLGDFGLAKFYDHGANPQTTSVVGTVGYVAPELIKTGKPTTSSDVFAFGIFMLEVACGRRPFDQQFLPEGMILVDWVFEWWKRGDILCTIDPKLEGNYVVEQMVMVLELGLLCADSVPAVRPSMRQVVNCLDGNVSFAKIPQDDGFGGSATAGSITVDLGSHNSANLLSSNDSILTYGR